MSLQVTDPEFSQLIYDISASTDKTLRLVPGAKHGDCFFSEAMYEDIGVWIGKQVGSVQPYALKEVLVEDSMVSLWSRFKGFWFTRKPS